MIVKTLGFGGIEQGRRHPRLDGERDAGGEPAAGGGHDHDIGDKTERAEIFDDFSAGGALAGDDQSVVIGRHQHGAASRRDVVGDRLAVIARAVVEHDLGAKRGGALAFGARRIARHHDHARHAEKPRRRGNALSVIAGRESDHAAGASLRRNRRELVVGAAEFERAGVL